MRNWRHKLLLACAIFGFATMTRSQTLSSCVAATHGEDSSECDEITTVGNLQIESKGRYFRISILDGEQVAQEIIYDRKASKIEYWWESSAQSPGPTVKVSEISGGSCYFWQMTNVCLVKKGLTNFKSMIVASIQATNGAEKEALTQALEIIESVLGTG